MKILLCKFFLMFPFHLGDLILNMAWLPAVCCTTEEPELSVLRQYKLIQNIGTPLITQLGTPGVLSFGSHLIRLMRPMAKTSLLSSTAQSPTA